MAKPPAPDEDEGESVTAPEPVAEPKRAFQVTSNLVVIAPEDCIASVLLKHVHTQSSLEALGEAIFVWWTVAGRHGLLAAEISYEHDGRHTVRIDVPSGVKLSSDYLLEQLKAHWHDVGGLPPDTPVIKGAV